MVDQERQEVAQPHAPVAHKSDLGNLCKESRGDPKKQCGKDGIEVG
jgi:hypothetical protein